MSIPVFPPSKDADLLAFSTNFDEKITASAARFGLDAAQATAYNLLHVAFANAYAAVINPNTNSKQAVITKNQTREALLNADNGAWQLVNIIQAFPGTTDADRGELGLRIPDTEQTPVAKPTTPPGLSILCTNGHVVSIKLDDQDKTNGRAKPVGVTGATILFFVGEDEPADPADWKFVQNASKTKVDVVIPATVPAGSKVWITAFWFNSKKQSSFTATPVSTNISSGAAQAA